MVLEAALGEPASESSRREGPARAAHPGLTGSELSPGGQLVPPSAPLCPPLRG